MFLHQRLRFNTLTVRPAIYRVGRLYAGFPLSRARFFFLRVEVSPPLRRLKD